jgi:hypothetical protein
MRIATRPTIYVLAGLTIFGVAYDGGLFGTPDGSDHSAVMSITAGSTGPAGPSAYVQNTIAGDGVAVTPPILGKVRRKPVAPRAPDR